MSAVGRTNASSASSAPTGKRLVDDQKNRLVSLDLSGFEPTSATVTKRTREAEEEEVVVVVKKSDPRLPKVDEQLLWLGPGESLWDPTMDPIRFNNILGGWGATDKDEQLAKRR
jgi:hypothetical protein